MLGLACPVRINNSRFLWLPREFPTSFTKGVRRNLFTSRIWESQESGQRYWWSFFTELYLCSKSPYGLPSMINEGASRDPLTYFKICLLGEPGIPLGLSGVKHPTLDLGSGHDLTVMKLSATLGSTRSLEPAWDSFSPSLSLYSSPALPCSLSLSL